MESATWAVPTEKILAVEQMEKVIEIAWRHDQAVGLAISIGATTALRLSEIYHIRCDDILEGGRIRITRRKKKVLKSEVIEVADGLYPFLAEQAKKAGGEWLFPGDAKGCKIDRRPQFKRYECPDESCKRLIADPSIYKKSGDLKRVFATHLTETHKWDMAKVVTWIEDASESKREIPCNCGGGHISGRHIQTMWKFATAEAGVMMRGRGFHTTRHFAISRYVEEHAGENPKEAQMFAGHSSLEMTMRYTHPSQLGRKVKAMKAMVRVGT